jgi:multiple sugar transport system permease protein
VVSLVYTIATVILQVVVGLALALFVMDMKRRQSWFRLIAILPVVLSPAVVGMIWRTFMLAPEFGIIDYLAITAGLGSKNWLGDPTLALVSVIVIHTWQWTPFAFMVLLASLAALPEDIYEAAKIDRASAWQRFVRITLPLIRPAIVMVIIMRTMVALTAFAAIFTVTGGGPGTATEILNLYAYRKSFTELSIGYGSALAVALLIVTIIISWLLFAIRRGK